MPTSIRRALLLCPLLLLAAAGASLLAQGAAPYAPPTLSPLAEHDTAPAGSTVRLALVVAVPPGLHLQSNRPRDPSLIPSALALDPRPSVSGVRLVFPEALDLPMPGFEEPLAVFEGTFVVGVEFELAETQAPGTLTVPARFRFQACNDIACFQPRTAETAWTLTVVPAGTGITSRPDPVVEGIDWSRAEAAPAAIPFPAPPAAEVLEAPPGENVLAMFDRFEILGVGNYMGTGDFLDFIANAEAGIAPVGMLDGRGPLAILAIVFIGGLALNLTPCVLPMIPINLAIIGAGAQSGRRGRGLLLGSAYGAAMALVYGTLGLVVILTAGTFGTINASPWFNLGIAVLFVVLGLAMFDVLSLDFSRYSSRIRFDDKSRGTLMLAFSMGTVAAVLAGACVAPVVVQVVVFASDLYASGTALALALPFVLGLGMALPWPVAGAGFAALPKPGPWMVRVKQAMGVFILATAAYYGYVAYEILASRWVDPAAVRASAEAQIEAGWHPSLAEGLRVAERDGTDVLVDFWATWCKNCLVMDETTLKDPAVAEALADYTRIKFQTEDLDASPARELLRRVGSIGLPTYVILRPRAARP